MVDATDQIRIEHAQNPEMRTYYSSEQMSNVLVEGVHRDFSRYYDDHRFDKIGAKGKRIIQRVFKECEGVNRIFIRKNDIGVMVTSVDFWERVEPIIVKILIEELHTKYQSY